MSAARDPRDPMELLPAGEIPEGAHATTYDLAIDAGCTKTAAQLLDLADRLGLMKDRPVHLPVEVRRTRAGRWQRAAGAWSWTLIDARGVDVIASCWPAREVLAAPFSHLSIADPCEVCVEREAVR